MNVLPSHRRRLYSFSESKFSETDNLPQVLKHDVIPRYKMNMIIGGCLFTLGMIFIIVSETALPSGHGCSPHCTTGQKKQLGLLLLGVLLTTVTFVLMVVTSLIRRYQTESVQKKLMSLRNNYILSWRCDQERWDKYVDKEYGEDGRAVSNSTQQAVIIFCCILFGSLLLSIKLKDSLDMSYGRTFMTLFGFCMLIYIPVHTILFITNRCIRRYMKTHPEQYYVIIDFDSVYFSRLYWWSPPDHCCDTKFDLESVTLEKMEDGLILQYSYAVHGRHKAVSAIRIPVPDLLADQVNDVLEQIDKGVPNKALTSVPVTDVPIA